MLNSVPSLLKAVPAEQTGTAFRYMQELLSVFADLADINPLLSVRDKLGQDFGTVKIINTHNICAFAQMDGIKLASCCAYATA